MPTLPNSDIEATQEEFGGSLKDNHIMGHRGCDGIFVEDVPYDTLPPRCVPTLTCSLCGLSGSFDYQDDEVEDRGILAHNYPA